VTRSPDGTPRLTPVGRRRSEAHRRLRVRRRQGDVKGNGWRLVGNHGVHAPIDGFQTHVQQPGWGQRTVFRGNHLSVGGRGYGFRIAAASHDTVVACDNDVRDAGKGASNIRCTP
jgi:hypothetical protein